jgi:hypothetical protein
VSEQTGEGYGDFHPEAAAYGPYNDAMAAWRNQVKAMQAEGALPAEQQAAPEAQSDAEPTQPVEGTQEPSTSSPEAQEGAEGSQDDNVVQRTTEEALDLNEDGTAKEGEPESAEQTMAQRDQVDVPDAQDGDEPKEVYDPSAHTAPDVLEYLKGVGEDEAKRVLESEEAGKNRKGITSLKDDVLAKARSNDETGSGSTSA